MNGSIVTRGGDSTVAGRGSSLTGGRPQVLRFEGLTFWQLAALRRTEADDLEFVPGDGVLVPW